MASDLAYNGTPARLEELGGPAKAILELEEVSFVAKNGPRKSDTSYYTKPRLDGLAPSGI